MHSKLISLTEAMDLINAGKNLLVAGDEQLLARLPRGNWIGGTIPYFMSDEGGVITREKVFVTILPEVVERISTRLYDEKTIGSVYSDALDYGCSFIILPATSPIHLSFALNAPGYADFATRPLVGWISGVHLEDLGKVAPKVIDGATGELTDRKAVVLRASLKPGYLCDVGIVNIFEQGAGDRLEFLESGFSATDVLVNGRKMNFADYLTEKKADTKLPLVANYCGANVNISFQGIDLAARRVDFYAPVFKGVLYKQASSVGNYVAGFQATMPRNSDNILFSCNCILNFLYSELEGKRTGNITGPITFGEVAYQLLNQTMVYLQLIKT